MAVKICCLLSGDQFLTCGPVLSLGDSSFSSELFPPRSLINQPKIVCVTSLL